jgi:hypothetical protein
VFNIISALDFILNAIKDEKICKLFKAQICNIKKNDFHVNKLNIADGEKMVADNDDDEILSEKVRK